MNKDILALIVFDSSENFKETLIQEKLNLFKDRIKCCFIAIDNIPFFADNRKVIENLLTNKVIIASEKGSHEETLISYLIIYLKNNFTPVKDIKNYVILTTNLDKSKIDKIISNSKPDSILKEGVKKFNKLKFL